MSCEMLVDRPHPSGMGGVQKIFRCDNGYGASVVRDYGSYGFKDNLWELAVIKFNGPTEDDFSLCYDTPITSDVEGYLTEDEVKDLLIKIEAL